MFWDDKGGHVVAGICAYTALAISILQVRHLCCANQATLLTPGVEKTYLTCSWPFLCCRLYSICGTTLSRCSRCARYAAHWTHGRVCTADAPPTCPVSCQSQAGKSLPTHPLAAALHCAHHLHGAHVFHLLIPIADPPRPGHLLEHRARLVSHPLRCCSLHPASFCPLTRLAVSHAHRPYTAHTECGQRAK